MFESLASCFGVQGTTACLPAAALAEAGAAVDFERDGWEAVTP